MTPKGASSATQPASRAAWARQRIPLPLISASLPSAFHSWKPRQASRPSAAPAPAPTWDRLGVTASGDHVARRVPRMRPSAPMPRWRSHSRRARWASTGRVPPAAAKALAPPARVSPTAPAAPEGSTTRKSLPRPCSFETARSPAGKRGVMVSFQSPSNWGITANGLSAAPYHRTRGSRRHHTRCRRAKARVRRSASAMAVARGTPSSRWASTSR